MSIIPTSDEATKKMIATLESLKVPYMLVGSLSSNIYGIPRSTKDADFVVQLDKINPSVVTGRMGNAYALDPQIRFETTTGTTCYRIRVRNGPFMIELFALSDDAHDRERFKRRVRVISPAGPTWVPTAEDVIITKLRWLLRNGRGKDHEDIRDVISVSGPRMDWNYIHQWCDIHDTRKLLDAIRATIPEI